MDSQQQYNETRQRAQRGVSLIEILVVLVILVTGILTIIRLFPSGFFSIQSTGNAALADGLGSAAIDLGTQSASSLPEAILPDNPTSDDLLSYSTNAAAYSNYDPDNPNHLENARVVSNETVTVPSAVNGQSVYVVKYGPVIMPGDTTSSVTLLPNYFTVNSPNWTTLTSNSASAQVVKGGPVPVATDIPQDTLVPGQEKFLVDLVNQRLAVPYALYTPTSDRATFNLPNGQSVRTAVSYSQKMVLTVSYFDSTSQTYGTFTRYLNVPPATPRDSTNPFAPFDSASLTQSQAYIQDTYTAPNNNYQGGWFDPTTQNQDLSSGTAGTSPTTGMIQWLSATLYRPYTGVLTGHSYSDVMSVTNYDPTQNDPYQFELTAANIGATNPKSANPGAISFNPKAAGGSGAQARKVKISYIVSSWGILREDHDVPALTGTGSTFVVRTAVPNLKLAGSANPDNSINLGLAGSNYSLVIMDLDTGKIIAPGGVADPTNPDKPLNNEDLNGPVPNDPSVINISYALGRLTFGSDAFADNPNPNQTPLPATGSGTSPAHRIRIFYTADLDWTVAVQKPAAYFQTLATSSGSPVQNATGGTALAAYQYAYDSADAFVYFARCNAGKTIEIDGTYTSGGTTQGFSDTVAIDPTLFANGDAALRVDLTDGRKFEHPVPPGAAVTFSAVRGLSARSIVAWKERNQYKVHSVDAVLSRTP